MSLKVKNSESPQPAAAAESHIKEFPARVPTIGVIVGWAVVAVAVYFILQRLNLELLEFLPVGALLPPLVVVVLGLASCVRILSPGHTLVQQFFGSYTGTTRRPGIHFVVPFTVTHTCSVRIRNFESNVLKVNDLHGNPINISTVVVWSVADTAKATFAVEDAEEFMRSQAESALRHVASQLPYSAAPGELSLSGTPEEVADMVAAEVAQRVGVAGLEVREARISTLAYAPEIAQAMLRRQQASAVVEAREFIVEGAVSMVSSALTSLEKQNIVQLDPERRANLVSNLLVVLCSENQTQPVLNAGSGE